ncbi:GNAT family N-acetyltransferase [uncultured Mameliella sp.]|uniref:GNAT family N-acetyltransferase n=1 Tax=uncultured Mameliella sp. TaxID=1447087 RepID=UPI00260D398B|nr:GNAT family N-acetyltransferase [uncultured Mameliella sp.]
MTGFATSRLRVTPWAAALDDPATRPALEHRLARILTPPVLRPLPPSVQLDGTVEQIANWIAARHTASDVWLVETGETLIGLLMLFSDPEGVSDCAHLGYLFAEEAWGKGYATELVQGLAAHLDETAPMTLLAGVDRTNPASARVLEKSGFLPDPETPTADTLRFRRPPP